MRKIQLDFLDGLRALLALYIVAHHAVQFLGVVPGALRVFGYGQAVVAVFLTVSGFCLALPQASSGQWTVDARIFFQRRARRILPPYYAALALAIGVSIGFQLLGPFRDPVGEFSAASVWSHLLLVQNWSARQMYTLDGPLWSIAVECQIYLLYPVLVLLRRRWGTVGMLAVAASISFLGFRIFHAAGQMHFLLFFTFGVVSAELAFAKKRQWIPLGMIATGVLAWVLLPHASTPQQEAFASLGSAGLIAYLCSNPASPLRRALQWKPLAWVGTFSYSIYLLHDLFLAAAWYWIRDRRPDFAQRFSLLFALIMGATCVAAVVGSYGFHVLFERPFMSRKRQRAEQRLAAA
ncbi:MAG: acyltransferase family protein [Janthinobacterium lividum]